MTYSMMIVDDSNVIRNRIGRNCQSMDLQVVAVSSNGADAVELYKLHQPQIVTMDLTMPKMDGLECIRQIIEIDEDANILVISALSDKTTGIRALELGARGFICKPFTDEDLTDALEEMMTGE